MYRYETVDHFIAYGYPGIFFIGTTFAIQRVVPWCYVALGSSELMYLHMDFEDFFYQTMAI